MDYFPQLSTGSSLQFPLKKSQVFRTLSVSTEDGRVSRYSDGGWRSVEWELQFSGLTSAEWTNLSGHFTVAEGRLRSFPFLDGSDNLLLWSEDPGQSAWTVDPLLHFSPGISDPVGGTRGIGFQNSGISWQGLVQSIPAPASFTYCFSVYARSAAGGQIGMFINGNGQQILRTAYVGTDWQRYFVSGSLAGTDNMVHFGLQVDQSNEVDLYGMQVEPQTAASRYKKTSSVCGVHAECRYDQDELSVISDRPESYATTIRLIAREPV